MILLTCQMTESWNTQVIWTDSHFVLHHALYAPPQDKRNMTIVQILIF